MYHDTMFHCGCNCFNQITTIVVAEQRHCYIGDFSVFSVGINIRNSDAHLIYKTENGIRRNMARSVYIGDHVWICQDALII